MRWERLVSQHENWFTQYTYRFVLRCCCTVACHVNFSKENFLSVLTHPSHFVFVFCLAKHRKSLAIDYRIHQRSKLNAAKTWTETTNNGGESTLRHIKWTWTWMRAYIEGIIVNETIRSHLNGVSAASFEFKEVEMHILRVTELCSSSVTV